MALFGRRGPKGAVTGADAPSEAALADEATRAGWAPVPPPVFESDQHERYLEASRVLHGSVPRPISNHSHPYGMNVHAAFRTAVDGRSVVVANGWTHLTTSLWGDRPSDFVGTSICVIELPGVPSLVLAQPRVLRPMARILKETPTGDASFDAAYRVTEELMFGPSVLTPEIRRLILARDDWIFLGDQGRFSCVGFFPFASVADMRERIIEVLAIIAAFPAASMPSVVDHSQDGLVARIARINSVEDALQFLQSLSVEERAELARSNTPLAAFSDVTTPEQAMARFESLPNADRLAVLTMFQGVGE